MRHLPPCPLPLLHRMPLLLMTLVSLLLGTGPGIAVDQAGPPGAKDHSAFRLEDWVFDQARVSVRESERFKGVKEMVQTGYQPNLCAWIKDLAFTDGTIECDMTGGAYLGIAFRVIAEEGDPAKRKSEDIYFRVEGNARPDTVQYYPHGKLKQEELHRPPYEAQVRPIKQQEWFHVRIEVSGTRAQVFLDRGKQPILVIENLMHEHRAGSVGLRSWGGSFANLKITPGAGKPTTGR